MDALAGIVTQFWFLATLGGGNSSLSPFRGTLNNGEWLEAHAWWCAIPVLNGETRPQCPLPFFLFPHSPIPGFLPTPERSTPRVALPLGC